MCVVHVYSYFTLPWLNWFNLSLASDWSAVRLGNLLRSLLFQVDPWYGLWIPLQYTYNHGRSRLRCYKNSSPVKMTQPIYITQIVNEKKWMVFYVNKIIFKNENLKIFSMIIQNELQLCTLDFSTFIWS